MSSLLEIKQMGCDWNKVIFATESLMLDHLTSEQAYEILRIICQEMSDYYVGEIFMPHEIASVVIGSMNVDEYNDMELDFVKSSIYDIVIGFSDIMFKVMKNYSVIKVIKVDENVIKVSYQSLPKEIY